MIHASLPIRTHRLLVGLVAVLAVLGAVLVPTSAHAAGGTLLSLMNSDRAANGLGPLQRNGSMDAVALSWANHMASTGTLAHNPSYASQIPGGWTRAAENVAAGYSTEGATHAGWMASAGHRANILGDFTSVGIAFISSGGKTWAVEVFGKYGSAPAPPSGSSGGSSAGSWSNGYSAPAVVAAPVIHYKKIAATLKKARALPAAPAAAATPIVVVDTPIGAPAFDQLKPSAVLPVAVPTSVAILLLAFAGMLMPARRLSRASALISQS